MLCLTLPDFNNLLNFMDIRGGELTLTLDGATVAAREIVSKFVSNTDVIMDRVDPKKLAARLSQAESFTIEMEKPYPFHEVLIRPCVELSVRHRHVYTPVLWIGRGTDFRPPVSGDAPYPAYGVVYEGDAGDLKRLQLIELDPAQTIRLKAMAIGAFFLPNPDLQLEVERRLISLSRRKSEGAYQEAVASNAYGDPNTEIFRQALMSLWPTEAIGRLLTYIHLREGREDITAFSVDTSLVGRDLPGRLGQIYEEVEVTPGVIASKAPYASLPRSREVDALALQGVFTYRAGEWSASAGWPVYVSPDDPTMIVRSNGVVRWMRQGHGLMESIERLTDGRNLALGARAAMELYGHLAPNRDILFGGLGLGVVQRAIALDSDSVTCEVNSAVIDAFNYIYPDSSRRLNILRQDIFEYVRAPPHSRTYAMAFLDFFDDEDRSFRPDIIANILNISYTVVISRHIRDAEDLHRCDAAIQRAPFPADRHVMEDKQLIVAFRRVDT